MLQLESSSSSPGLQDEKKLSIIERVPFQKITSSSSSSFYNWETSRPTTAVLHSFHPDKIVFKVISKWYSIWLRQSVWLATSYKLALLKLVHTLFARPQLSGVCFSETVTKKLFPPHQMWVRTCNFHLHTHYFWM